MSLQYEPSSEPLHISVKLLFLNSGGGLPSLTDNAEYEPSIEPLLGNASGLSIFNPPSSQEREGVLY